MSSNKQHLRTDLGHLVKFLDVLIVEADAPVR